MPEFYLNNTLLNGKGHQHRYTRNQIKEIGRCRDDIEYFAEKYFTIVHIDEGKMKIPLYSYQKDLLHEFQDNRFNIVAQARQSGKSTTLTVYILHYILFSEDKTVALLANKGDTSQELLSRIKLAFELLPLWLKPNVVEWNKRTVEFENGCSIMARATSSASIRGESISLVAIDEAAFVEDWESFYRSTYPTISAGKKSKVIMISTMNGMNHFHFLREAARTGRSNYTLFEVIWSDVPGRDEEWKAETIRNTSQEAFDQEHCNIALGSSNTLVPSSVLQQIVVRQPYKVLDDLNYYYEVDPNRNYVITVDTSRGKGLDFSVAVVWDVSQYPLKQVAVFRSDEMSPLLYPNLLYGLGIYYNYAWILVENNDMGAAVVNALNYDLEYEFIINNETGEATKYELGVKTTKTTKRIGCVLLKNLLENNKLILCDEENVLELSNFISKGTSYEAEKGFHDDIVMCGVMLAWFTQTDAFFDIIGSYVKNELYADRVKHLEEQLAPLAIILNGLEDDDLIVEDGDVWSLVG